MTEQSTEAFARFEQLVRGNAVSANTLNEFDTGLTPFAVVPDNCKVTSLEPYLDRPARHKAHVHTESIKAFIGYAEFNVAHTGKPLVLVRDGMHDRHLCATLLFDFGDNSKPSWRDNTASIRVPMSAEGKAAKDAIGRVAQREFAEWLEDWRDYISAYNGEDQMTVANAVRAVRNLKIEARASHESSAGDLQASRTSMEEIEAKARDGMRLPTRIHFACTPFPEMEPHIFEYRLAVSTDPNQKQPYNLIPVRHDLVEEQIVAEFKARIAAEFGALESGVTVLVGQLK